MISEMSQQHKTETQTSRKQRIDLASEELKKLKRADEFELIEIPVLKDRVQL